MDTNRILRSTATVSACTALSRILGFVREVLMAVFFGTTLAKSAFDVAFRIPNLFRRLFGEGALSAAFIPVFSETLENEGPEKANMLAGKVMTMLGVTLAVLVAGGVLATTLVIRYAALGQKAAAVLPLLRIMLPYMFFICIVALCMAILNSFHHFAVPACTPVLLNVVWIIVLLAICPRFGGTPEQRIYGVAWGILAAGCLQLLVQVPALRHFGFRPRLSFAWKDANVIRVVALMGPVAMGMGIHQVNVCIDGLLALWAAPWAPAALVFAERLVYLPLGIFATALGTVLLPTFSRQAVRDDRDAIAATAGDALRNLMLVMVPAAVGLIVLAKPIVRLVFEWQGGMFDSLSTARTARALCFYAPGLVVFSVYKILVPAFYAVKDVRTPVRVGAVAVLLNFLLNVTFVLTWPLEYKHAGLALATVVASAVNGAMLGWIMHRRIGSPGWSALAGSSMRILVAASLMGLCVASVYRVLAALPCWEGVGTKVAQVAVLAVVMVLGLVVYTVGALLFCRRETRSLLAALRKDKA